MSIKIIGKPKLVAKYNNSAIVNWENVFSISNESNIDESTNGKFTLQIYDSLTDWTTVYWGTKTLYECKELAPTTCYKMRIKFTENVTNLESDWVDFKIATSCDQFFVLHLTRAVKYDKVSAIKKILNQSPHLLETVTLSTQRTQLHEAILAGNSNAVHRLLTYGAAVDKRAPYTERTALMLATFNGDMRICQMVLDKKPSLQAGDVNGLNALHYAVDGDQLSMVELMVKVGVNVDACDNKGWTPLIRAVIMNSSDAIISLLLKLDTNPLIKDKNGYDFYQHCKLVDRKVEEFKKTVSFI